MKSPMGAKLGSITLVEYFTTISEVTLLTVTQMGVWHKKKFKKSIALQRVYELVWTMKHPANVSLTGNL